MSLTRGEHTSPNIELLDLVLKTIETDRRHWCQRVWRTMIDSARLHRPGKVDEIQVTCGTSFCFAGWAVQLGSETTPVWLDTGYLEANEHDNPLHITGGTVSVAARATRLLGIDYHSANALYDGGNSLPTIRRMVHEIKEKGVVS